MSDYIKLKTGQVESITLTHDQPIESDGQYGKQYIYGCNPIITGESKFTANPRVHGLIQELGVGSGDVLIIEKVKANPNDYIKVDLPGVPVEKNNPLPTHKSIEKPEKQIESKTDGIDLHELTLRVEKLEKMVTTLSSEAGHKPGDEDIPF
tara:strand:- start:124 stop:576 length:453 start_codon:yes stop_codon:yes gene_type:complete